MRKCIALVLLLSFVSLLWAQKDTCLQTENEAVDVEEGTSDEQTGDMQNADLLQLTPKPSFIYTQEYFTSEQDTTETTESDGGWKFLVYPCCIGTVVLIVGCFVFLKILADSGFGAIYF